MNELQNTTSGANLQAEFLKLLGKQALLLMLPLFLLYRVVNSALTMGIQGLLQFIKEASEPVNVKKYRGQAVAVDTYCWLHKGAIACAEKLAKGEPTDR